MQMLMGDLTEKEFWVIYLMGLGKEMPESVTKKDLTRIIYILCKKQNWVEEDSYPIVDASTLKKDIECGDIIEECRKIIHPPDIFTKPRDEAVKTSTENQDVQKYSNTVITGQKQIQGQGSKGKNLESEVIEMEDNPEVEEISANRQDANVSLSNTPELIRLLNANPNPKLVQNDNQAVDLSSSTSEPKQNDRQATHRISKESYDAYKSRKETVSTNKPLKCPKCEKKFPWSGVWNRRLSAAQTGAKQLICPHCHNRLHLKWKHI